MANHEIAVPDCFSHHTLGDPICEFCPSERQCLNNQAGWGIFETLGRLSEIIVAEKGAGGVPDLVFELDRKMTDEAFEKLRHEHPEIFRWYMRFNGISSG